MLLEGCLGTSEASYRLCEQLSKQGVVLEEEKSSICKIHHLKTDSMIIKNTALSGYAEMTDLDLLYSSVVENLSLAVGRKEYLSSQIRC